MQSNCGGETCVNQMKPYHDEKTYIHFGEEISDFIPQSGQESNNIQPLLLMSPASVSINLS